MCSTRQQTSDSRQKARIVTSKPIQAWLGLAVTVLAASQAGAQIIGPPPVGSCSDLVDPAQASAAYVSRFGVSGSELQSTFFDPGGLAGQGYRPVRLTGYQTPAGTRFFTRWVRIGGPEWRGYFGMTSGQFHERFLALRDEFRLIDASAYAAAAGVRYAALWIANDEGVAWRVHRDVPESQMPSLIATLTSSGWVPTRVEGYLLDGASHAISLWQRRGCATRMRTDMTRETYLDLLDQHAGEGFRLEHLDTHNRDDEIRYAAIWWKRGGAWEVRSNRDWYLFQRLANNFRCSGMVLTNFTVAEVGELAPGGIRFGGIWSDVGGDPVAATGLRALMKKHIECAPARGGAALLDLGSGEEITIHADQPFGASSTIKIAILYALLRKADAEGIDVASETLNVGAPYGSNQAGLLEEDGDYTLAFLARAMISVSNNWATNRLIDLIGQATINQELAALGLSTTRLRRYMTGNGPQPNAATSYRNGLDATFAPREMVSLLERLYLDQGALLTTESKARFWATLSLDGDGPPNAKGYVPFYFDVTAGEGWPDRGTVFNKAGSNTWSGEVGDFSHRPQLGTHHQRSEAGLLELDDGRRVIYAMGVDEADPEPDAAGALRCAGFELARRYLAEIGFGPFAVPTPCQ